MFVNWTSREMHLKIVYYGPALSGKTTNLQYLHARLDPKLRGELVSLKTREDRTLYFDFLQVALGQIKGLTPKFNLYTVPGQVYYTHTRKLVLQGADGIVFVVDSQPVRLRDNLASLRDMHAYLRELGNDPARFPTVMQFNKRDLPGVVSEPVLYHYLGLNGVTPYFQAVATQGKGVFETLKTIINLVVAQVQHQV
jgi:signal recognition particle receptor subunit beta